MSVQINERLVQSSLICVCSISLFKGIIKRIVDFKFEVSPKLPDSFNASIKAGNSHWNLNILRRKKKHFVFSQINYYCISVDRTYWLENHIFYNFLVRNWFWGHVRQHLLYTKILEIVRSFEREKNSLYHYITTDMLGRPNQKKKTSTSGVKLGLLHVLELPHRCLTLENWKRKLN